VAPQHINQGGIEGNGATTGRSLGEALDRGPLDHNASPYDPKYALLKIDFLPAESAHLAPAHPTGQQETPDEMETILGRGGEELAGLLCCPRLHRDLWSTGPGVACQGIALDQPDRDRPLGGSL